MRISRSRFLPKVDTGSCEGRHVAEPGPGDAAGLVGVHPGLDQLAGAHLEMEGDFFVHLLVDAAPATATTAVTAS